MTTPAEPRSPQVGACEIVARPEPARPWEAALVGYVPTWPVAIVDFDHPDAREVIDARLVAGKAVLVIASSEQGVADALALGAAHAITWAGDPALLRAHVDRAVRLARLPWLERLFDLASDSVEMTDQSVHLRDVNPGFERITGYARDQAIGRTTGELFRSEAADPAYYRQIGHGLSTEGVWRGQLTARRRDGSLSFQQATIALVPDPTGRVVGHMAIKRDTSRDNLAWAALRGAEARTQVLLDRAAEGVLLHTADGRIADVNGTACRMLGLDRGDVLSLKVQDLEEADPAALTARWTALTTEPRILETVWRRADGHAFPVELSLARTEVVGAPFILAIARDISERRAAEVALAEAHRDLQDMNETLEARVQSRTRESREGLARLRTVLDNLADGLLTTDLEGRVELSNSTLKTMLREASAEQGGLAVDVHPVLGALARESMDTRSVRSAELPLFGQSVGHATSSPVVVEDESGPRCIGSVILVRDITLAKEVDRMKTDFIATVSHELRTPLTSVLGFAKLAHGKLEGQIGPSLDPEDRKVQRALRQVTSNLEIIVDEGRRLSDLINDVLDISKMEAGRVDWRVESIHPTELAERAIAVTSGLFQAGGPTLLRDLDPSCPAVDGDPDRLLQVIINLISNAVKFTPRGTVTLTTRAEGSGVRFEVRDTGSGIPRDQHKLIFEKFKQASGVLTDKPRGTGLGLPISKHIVEHHGGRIWVESEVDRGSTFSFVLPSRRTSGDTAPRRASGPAREASEGTRSTPRELGGIDDRTSSTSSLSRRTGTAESGSGRSPSASTSSLARLLDQVESVAQTPGTAGSIVVVDDDPAVRELLRQQLGEAGYRVRLAGDGLAAIETIRQERPDVVILDVVMPMLSGFDVAAMLRGDPTTADLPIILHSILVDRPRGKQLGVDRYLAKPIDARDLVSAVESLLRRTHQPGRVLVITDDGSQADAIRQALTSHGSLQVHFASRDVWREAATRLVPDLVLVATEPAAGQELVTEVREHPRLSSSSVVVLMG